MYQVKIEIHPGVWMEWQAAQESYEDAKMIIYQKEYGYYYPAKIFIVEKD